MPGQLEPAKMLYKTTKIGSHDPTDNQGQSENPSCTQAWALRLNANIRRLGVAQLKGLMKSTSNLSPRSLYACSNLLNGIRWVLITVVLSLGSVLTVRAA